MITKKTFSGLPLGLLVAFLLFLAGLLVMRMGASSRQGSGLSKEFTYDLTEQMKIDPALVQYRQEAEFATGFEQAAGICVATNGLLYVAGDKAVRIIDGQGKPQSDIALSESPRCVAVDPAGGMIYVGMKNHVEVLDPAGKSLASWAALGDRAVVTSIAVAPIGALVADAGNRQVLRYSLAGDVAGRLEDFMIPSPYFDVAFGPDSLPRVADPGRHRIATFGPDGDRLSAWGKAGTEIDAFAGCCNPCHFAMLRDGSYVTSEKGLPRIKIYGPDGRFQCVVAGPDAFGAKPGAEIPCCDVSLGANDVAAGPDGRIYVLDNARKTVRIFVQKDGSNG